MTRKNILLSLAAALMLAGCADSDNSITTATAEIGAVESTVEDSGTAVHLDPYTIYPEVNGKIIQCSFEEGDSVQKGDALYTIDSTALEDQITQAQLSLKSAKQSLAQAKAACADLTVTAHASGTVTALYLHVGDLISAGSPIAEIEDQQNFTLTVPFTTAEAAAISPGAAAQITFTGYTGTVNGTVKRIYDTPSALNGGRQGSFVEITFANPGALSGSETAFAQVGDAMCMEAGTIAPGTKQTLYANQSGEILSLFLETGALVSAGQQIMTLKNDSLTNAAENAALAVETAQVNLNQLTAKRSDYTIYAPASGTILSRYAKSGDYAAAISTLAVLAEENSLGAEVAIDEIYIDKIYPGQSATLTFTDDAGQNYAYTAQVRRVDETGIVSGGVTDYTVELTLAESSALRAGMNVNVSILVGRSENCLRIPTAAIAGDHTVQLLVNGESEVVVVETGLSGGGYTEILSGLQEGDLVILP